MQNKARLFVLAMIGLGISVRIWLIYHHFPHYDDLWGYYRAAHLKLMPPEDFIDRLPASLGKYSGAIASLPLLDWLLRHMVSIREASFHTTLAPLHYLFSLLFVGHSTSYSSALGEARVVTVIEYITFMILFGCLISKRSDSEKPVLNGFLLLSLFGSLPLYYSSQGHNYMAGLTVSVGYLFTLEKVRSTSLGSTALRAFAYIICILTSYNFILLLPAYFATEVYLLITSKALYAKAQCARDSLRRFINPCRFSIFLTPLIISVALKALYIMPNTVGRGWNAGFNNEYIVAYASIRDFLLGVCYSLSSTLAALYLPSSESVIANAVLFSLLVPLIIVGMTSTFLLRSRHKATDVFSSVSLVTFFLLYLAGRIALSPTRHSLILYVFIALVVARGSSVTIYVAKNSPVLAATFSQVRSLNKNLSVLPIVIGVLAGVIYIDTICTELTERRDALTDRYIGEMSKVHSIYYDEYYNFSLSIAPELRHMKENLVSWPDRKAPVLEKSISSKAKPGDVIVYATNSFEEKDVDELAHNIEQSSGCSAVDPLTLVHSHKSKKIVDAPPAPLTDIGTNTLWIYKTFCR